jgi:hypothetical protein
MNVRQVVGILIVLGAYGLTWFFLLKSLRIVKIIDKEGLDHASEIKIRFKQKRSLGRSGESARIDESNRPGESDQNGQ